MTDTWEPSNGTDTLSGAVFEALGSASVCWDEVPHGVFDSTRAKAVGDGLLAWIAAHPDAPVS